MTAQKDKRKENKFKKLGARVNSASAEMTESSKIEEGSYKDENVLIEYHFVNQRNKGKSIL